MDGNSAEVLHKPMLVTKKTDYAVRCVLHLAGNGARISNVTEISSAMFIPKLFLAKILQRLVKAKIVESTRGMNGGFRLARKPKDISLLDIMDAIQGRADIAECAVDKNVCGRSGMCSVHPVWVNLRKEVEQRLQSETIDKLIGT